MAFRDQLEELGFGTKSFENSERLIMPGGKFNVIKKGGGMRSFSLYHWLIELNIIYFYLFVLVSYIAINTLFACVYFYIGGSELTIDSSEGWPLFLDCFYFSTQTLTTVGFGGISPVGNAANIVASFEAMVGLLGFAFATGLMYGRFSKARAKILFSKKALISPYRGITGFMFRIANLRKNQLIEMNASVMVSMIVDEDGVKKRRYSRLDLEIDFIAMFPLPWTIVHPIDEKSPLFEKSVDDLKKADAEFIIILKGYDDTFNQYVHQIHSFKPDEIEEKAKFLPMFDAGFEKSPVVYLKKISDYERV